MKKILIIVLSLLLLAACSASVNGLKSDVWEMADEYYKLIDDSVNENKPISDSDVERILSFTMKYRSDNNSENERKIANGILELMKIETNYQTGKALKDKRHMEITQSKFNEVKLNVRKQLDGS